MEKSESIKNLADALCKFQSGMGAIAKDSDNPFFKSRYASLAAIIEDTREGLAKNGLSYAQFPAEDGLTTVLMHNSGEWMAARFAMKPVDSKPQSVGSALTYARRYALCAILGLQVEDDDGNEASKPAAVAKPVPPAKVASKRDVQKARIKELVDEVTLVEVTTGGEYKDYVKENTGYELVPENFESIIDALEAIKNKDGE